MTFNEWLGDEEFRAEAKRRLEQIVKSLGKTAKACDQALEDIKPNRRN